MKLKTRVEVRYFCDTCDKAIPEFDVKDHVLMWHRIRKITTKVTERRD